MILDFDKPHIIGLLLLLSLLILGLYLQKKWSDSRIEAFSSFKEKQDQIFDGLRQKNFLIHWLFFILALICIIFALMDPIRPQKAQDIFVEGADIVFALDLSSSMDAKDVAPSRLEKAKKIILNTLENFDRNRAGLIYFAGRSYIASPLTSDIEAITDHLEILTTDIISSQGTDLGAAVEESVLLLSESPVQSKAVVILSDGEDHQQKLTEALKLAKQEKTQVFTVGLGTQKGAQVPILRDGYILDYKSKNGRPILSKLQPTRLIEIANATGGKYLVGSRSKETAQKLLSGFDALEKTKRKETLRTGVFHDYQWALGLGIFFMLLHFFTERKKTFLR